MPPLLLSLLAVLASPFEPTRVDSLPELRAALAAAQPGTIIEIAPGDYEAGFSAADLAGTAERPIIIRAADRKRPPVFRGGRGIHFSRVDHLRIEDLVIEKTSANGINIDDGGRLTRPSRGIVLARLQIADIGPRGNIDGIKLSGVDDFRVEDCLLERWGSGGSGIDMVGCNRGEIVGCRFVHGDATGDNGVQTKGGSTEIVVRRCRFDHAGQRAINIGGSTGLAFFRPKPAGHEASRITVEDCVFDGSTAAIAFVGVDGATVRRNTIHRPRRWAFRILQETRAPGFVPSRKGAISENLIVFRAGEMVDAVNVGDAVDAPSFRFERNAWFCLDRPDRSRPRLPSTEIGGRYGVEPRFESADSGDFRLRGDSPLRDVGARLEPPGR
ncbi:MAG: right-handed parallel beta-helix repeat-containing protein [Isosphaeraceae bacterium]|nr:right-handed parallel beta-helix repeat-containing protein [Isosphaeraceae bacterium]